MDQGQAGSPRPRRPAFDQRQWRHQVRSARALIAAPGSLPLLWRRRRAGGGGRGRIDPLGPASGRAGGPAVIPYERLVPIRSS